MKIITYQCNVCSETFSQKEAVGEKKVRAIYFTTNKDWRIDELPSETDRHICVRCLDCLVEQWADPR